MYKLRSLLSSIILLIVSIPVANACSCPDRSQEQQFREAKTVVVGVVREIHFVQDQQVFGGGYIRATVDVRETFKGKVVHHLEVIDEIPEGGMCSSFLRAGLEFVLFVDENQKVGMCSGTHPLGATIHDRPDKLKELQLLKSRAEP